MKDKLITVVVVEPGKKPYVESIPSSLEGMQSRVGGYIQAIYPFEDPVAIVCDEEAKLKGAPLNRALQSDDLGVYDVIAGTFFIAGCGKDDFVSLSEEQQAKYTQMFMFPERFAKVGDDIVAIKYAQF